VNSDGQNDPSNYVDSWTTEAPTSYNSPGDMTFWKPGLATL